MEDAKLRTASCVDCGMTILGDRARCPACHDLHAVSLGGLSLEDDAATMPRPRQVSPSGVFVRWIVVVEAVVIVGLALILVAKGCA